MRPRELTLNGFRSYADEATFDWTGRNLVGIVGPIGSGKSSILDAIAFALYGKTPRIERDTKSLINQRRDAMHVSLTFDVEGETWKAIRVLRRSGASSHVLYRVEGGDAIEVTDKAREMGERIESLLGLDFDGFRRSVLLAQNQFATFLEATGTDRNQVLKGVFGFERLDAMRTVTKERLDGIDRSLATLAGRRSSATEDAAALEQRRVALATAEERERTLEELRVPFGEAKEVIAGSQAKIAAADLRTARLGEISQRIPQRDQVEDIVRQASAGSAAVTAAEEQVAHAEVARREATAAVQAALEEAGGRAGLDAAADLVHRWRTARQRLDETASRLETTIASEVDVTARAEATEAALGALLEREATASAESAAATDALQAARDALAAAQQDHRAHALRGELHVGEPCPVCSQVVATLPAPGEPTPLDAAQRVLEAAQANATVATEALREVARAVTEARSEAAAAAQARSGATAGVIELRDAVAESRRQLEELTTEVTQSLGAGDPQETLTQRRQAVDEAEQAAAGATAAEESARAAVLAARAAAQEAQTRLTALRTAVAAVAGALDLGAEIGDGPEALEGALVAVREAWIGRQQAADGDRARAVEEAAAAKAALGEMLGAAGLAEGDDVVEVIAAARAERSGIEAEVQLLEKRLGELEQLGDEETALIESSALLRTLHGDLAPSKFLEFVLDERRRALGDLASEHLEVLTGGRYRFDESGEFLLVDLTAADAVRSPASLSGGETFLASLALALALAEIVAREGGRLDAFFLDEGFGSLDPEHLDLAMDGVERLVTSGPGRLVVVVSHVPALQERIEDLVVLDRDVVTGNTRIVSGRTAP